MTELPLSKFAPFNKQEAQFQHEVSNKLDEIGVKCSNCIYFGEKLLKPYLKEYTYFEIKEDKEIYSCNILSDKYGDNVICENSLCRFFTNKEEIEDIEEIKDIEKNNEYEDYSKEELSIQIQKLDFNNSNIIKSINKLREKIINE